MVTIVYPDEKERPDYNELIRFFGFQYNYYSNTVPNKRWTWYTKESILHFEFKYASDEFLFRLIYL